ncbi:MAG: hypothetical protein UU17_C0006G0032 [Candidatus Nomurabacteria bacterium GW2011_GWA1_40_8]|nr:MAG: hypothetical protein UU17_C0006G0032 [Candidatus Nomurabacteria bacterium GW2011_GWA1_40_8]
MNQKQKASGGGAPRTALIPPHSVHRQGEEIFSVCDEWHDGHRQTGVDSDELDS